MRRSVTFPNHSTAFEVDTDDLEGAGCACILCRPQGALLSFVSRDNLSLSGGRPAHRFDRQRLNHQFTAVAEADATPNRALRAPKFEKLQYRRRA
jgi:hypothetical protein